MVKKSNIILKIALTKLPRVYYVMPPTGYLVKSKKKYYRCRDKKINLAIEY
ncbi:hypothetical protein [Candidatus Phytoplasma pyri]|uniref:hypothetical protein n=1 Tax=Candidatus Phytoplasma pyri TaxID=47566 RepID=UPI003982EC98